MSEETETIGPSAARYRLTSSRPIPITHALLLTERVHKALVEHCCTSSTFTGCDSRRRPLKGHGHAYILCESSPSEGQITHVTVYSSSGFSLRSRQPCGGWRAFTAGRSQTRA